MYTTQTIMGTKTFADYPNVPTPNSPTNAANKAYVDSATANGARTTTSNTFNGNQTVKGTMNTTGDVNVDSSSANAGPANNFYPALRFGCCGEGIASNRASKAAGNRYGLDFYTNSNRRMSITQGGNVGIGTTAPANPLTVVGVMSATGDFIGDAAGANHGSISPGVRLGSSGSGEGLASKRNLRRQSIWAGFLYQRLQPDVPLPMAVMSASDHLSSLQAERGGRCQR